MQSKRYFAELLPLLTLFLVGMLFLTLVNALTKNRIIENAKQQRMQMMSRVLSGQVNEAMRVDLIELPEPLLTGDSDTLYVYRQWSDHNPAGIALYPVIARGYMDRISLVIGIAADDRITGIRIVEHNETPGIGDRIRASQSDWLQQFTGLPVTELKLEDWTFKSDQGIFDALSGATITSRGVINAVHKTAEIYAIRKQTFYSLK